MNKIVFLSIGLLFITLSCFAQRRNPVPTFEVRSMNIFSNDSTYLFDVYIKEKKFKLESDLFYYWYGNDLIRQNQGSIGQKPLHGLFKVLNADKNMVVQGQFHYGLKDGIWKRWDNKGNLLEMTEYDEGVLNGEKIIYNPADNSRKVSVYRNGVLKSEKEILPVTEKEISRKKDKKEKELEVGEQAPVEKQKKEKRSSKQKVQESDKEKDSEDSRTGKFFRRLLFWKKDNVSEKSKETKND